MSKALPLINSRPADIYHPDFTLGRPAYFDLSVRCATQPSFISAAASKAGVAAAADEEAKDDHYLETVSNQGGEFSPWFSSRLVFGHALLYQP